MQFEPATDGELRVIAEQLGRTPRGPVGVATRCHAGHPAVLINYPLQRQGERLIPFPTLYWLSCPELVKAVSRLEMTGLIDQLEARIAAEPELAAALEADHRRYIENRWSLLTDADRQELDASGMVASLRDRGIGGLARRDRIKCLHLHFAHHLAEGNVIGAIVAAEHGVALCPAHQPRGD